MNRVERRKAAKRSRLIAAARKVFADKGFHATTIGDITEAADVGFGTFYLYFPSKEAIFRAVVEEGFARLQEEIGAARAAVGDFEGQIRSATRAYMRFACNNRDLFRSMFDAGPISLETIYKLQQSFIERITVGLQLGVALGAVRPINTEIVAWAVVAAIGRTGLWWQVHDGPGPDEVADELADFILYGLAGKQADGGS